MPLDLSDPAVASALIGAVDRRVDQRLAQRLPMRGYGVVASVSPASRSASVYVAGQAIASPGFKYGPDIRPAVGELVRYVVDGGDRYIEARSTGGDYVVPSGASFPASPVLLDRFYRTDLGEICTFDGVRWLGEVAYSRMVNVSAQTVNSNTDYCIMLTRDVKIVRWKVNVLTLTTNNASNFWTVRLRDTDRSSSFQGIHGSFSCQNMGTVWSPVEVVNSDVVDEANRLGILFDFFKTGSPGALHMYGDIVYQPVYT